MTDFPQLSESTFVPAREQFHSVAKVIGKFRETLVKPIAKNDNLWLAVGGHGFSAPPIEQYNDLAIGCNIQKLIVEIANNKNQYDSIDINLKTQVELSDELASLLSKYGITQAVDSGNFDSGRKFEIGVRDAEDFMTQLSNYSKLLEDFWRRINSGVKSQICLWPHHFDNAFKWFSGRKIDEQDEQMGVGFSNGDGTYEMPYTYMTFWPPLRKTNTLEIAEGAILHDTDWTGLVLPYESVEEKHGIEDQSRLIANFFDISFSAVQRAFSKR